ncbi:MAG: hypothetical protein V4579_00865 [Pseudomonadota bacterium]
MRRIVTLPFAAALAFALSPALAQDNAAVPAAASDRVNQVIVYGDDPCPVSRDDEITVCARKAESERYRIPAPLRETPSSAATAWSERVLAYETVGAAGTNSCSAVGPGGVTGCLQKLINNAYAEKRGATDVQFSKMIEEERQKRLSTIDPEASAAQAQVEAAEKDYDARQRALEESAAPAEPAAPPARPVTQP